MKILLLPPAMNRKKTTNILLRTFSEVACQKFHPKLENFGLLKAILEKTSQKLFLHKYAKF